MKSTEPLLEPDVVEVLKTARARAGMMRLVDFIRKVQNATNVAKNTGESDANATNVVNETNVAVESIDIFKDKKGKVRRIE